MICMGDLQRAVEDVILRPDQNSLKDIGKRNTLAALDLCEPIPSPNTKKQPPHHTNSSYWSSSTGSRRNISFTNSLTDSHSESPSLLPIAYPQSIFSASSDVSSNDSRQMSECGGPGVVSNPNIIDSGAQMSMSTSLDHMVVYRGTYGMNFACNRPSTHSSTKRHRGAFNSLNNSRRKRSNSVSSCPIKSLKQSNATSTNNTRTFFNPPHPSTTSKSEEHPELWLEEEQMETE
uniref:Sterile alpha and TIR motif-containing protein 1 n=1 Tax=Rhabditophanes sp. KR3021 TaxID=114890 RepID=A0AC35TIM2_9BILA